VTGVTLDKATASVAVGATTALNVTVNPASASDTSFRVATSDGAKATVTVSGNAITVTGVAAGTADVIVMTSDGNFVAVCKVTVTQRKEGRMFLKKKFTWQTESLTIFELSALQRIEYITFMAQRKRPSALTATASAIRK
jgi:uncharacterized protein YjdB